MGAKVKMSRFLLIVIVPLLLLAACASFLPQTKPKEVFILASKQEKFCDTPPNKEVRLNIIEQNSSDFYRTSKILFRNNSQLGSFQFAEWSEPVTLRIQRLITERLRCQGYQIENLPALDDKNGIILKYTVLDFSHEASVPPGKFNGTFRISTTKGLASKEKLFTFQSNVASYDVAGAINAADQVVEQLLLQIVGFLSE